MESSLSFRLSAELIAGVTFLQVGETQMRGGGGVLCLGEMNTWGVLCGTMTSFISTSSSTGSEATNEEEGTAGDGGGERSCNLVEAGVMGTVVLQLRRVLPRKPASNSRYSAL